MVVTVYGSHLSLFQLCFAADVVCPSALAVGVCASALADVARALALADVARALALAVVVITLHR